MSVISQASRSYSDSDIIFGKGGHVISHPGNRVFRLMVFLNKELYHSIPKEEKELVSKSIVQSLNGDGRRFMKKVKGTDEWEEVDDAEAIKKTSQRLRDAKTMPSCENHEGKIIPLEHNPLLFKCPSRGPGGESVPEDIMSTKSLQRALKEEAVSPRPPPVASPQQTMSESVAGTCRSARRSKRQKDQSEMVSGPSITATATFPVVSDQQLWRDEGDDLIPIAVLPPGHPNKECERSIQEAELMRYLTWMQQEQLPYASEFASKTTEGSGGVDSVVDVDSLATFPVSEMSYEVDVGLLKSVSRRSIADMSDMVVSMNSLTINSEDVSRLFTA